MILFKNKKYIFLLVICFLLNVQTFAQNNVIISSINISGNEKTKREIIIRELTFNIGDSLTNTQLTTKITESKKNLLNTPLFNFVNINIVYDSLNFVKVNIKVEERWYFWPQASIYYADRNFSNWLKNRDLSRTDFGIGLIKYNFRGRNEKLSFYSIFGYDNEFLLKYDNLFFDKKRQHSGGVYFNYLRRRETGYIVKDDKLQQLKLNDEYALKSFRVNFNYTFRKEIFNKYSAFLGFENRQLSDSLINANPNYLTNSEKEVNYFSLKLFFIRDKRNYRIMPTKGYYLKSTIGKYGLGIFSDNDINSFYIKSEFSKYTELTNRFTVSNNLTLKYRTKNKQAFFLNTALGYSSNIRGYEYYVINGTNFGLLKNTLTFKLLPKKIIHLKWLPLKNFNKIHFTIYTSVYADAAYVKNSNLLYNHNNYLANKFLYSYGASVYLLTYYDWFLRLDFTRNHLKETGFYFHLEAPF